MILIVWRQVPKVCPKKRDSEWKLMEIVRECWDENLSLIRVPFS